MPEAEWLGDGHLLILRGVGFLSCAGRKVSCGGNGSCTVRRDYRVVSWRQSYLKWGKLRMHNRGYWGGLRGLWLVGILALLTGVGQRVGLGASCKVVAAHAPSEAEAAFLAADYEKSVGLYRAALAKTPQDAELTAGLVRVFLRQEKVKEAADTVEAALKSKPDSAVLLTAKAEVEFRQGVPWEMVETLAAALKADPCVGRLHRMYARLAGLNSQYALAEREIVLAHKLDATDPDIRGDWIGTLPLRERVSEMQRYQAEPTGDDAEEKHHGQLYLDHLKKRLSEPHQSCRLTSAVTATEIPFAALTEGSNRLRGYGLEVKLNQRGARLEIDTGASGLVVSRSVAQRAGLKAFSETTESGVGDHGESRGYLAYADSIRIGNMEFHDCLVDVVENKHMLDIDGLIGMDVFSKFLVTLNYPKRALALGPLPPRPGETAVGPALDTEEDEDGGDVVEGLGAAVTSAGAEGTGNLSAPKRVRRVPHDRYIAPEMRNYTAVFRIGHDLILPVSLNKKKVKLFILDTGAWATSIAPTAAREVTKVRGDDTYEIHGVSGKVEKVYSADDITFYFGGVSQQISEVPSFDLSSVSKSEGTEISGFLGARTLQQLTIHIDYRDGLVKFDYDAKANQNLLPTL